MRKPPKVYGDKFMKTPIYDFVKKYAESGNIRMHMPGHKGSGNIEKYDITEISDADSLYEADGIIKGFNKNGCSKMFLLQPAFLFH